MNCLRLCYNNLVEGGSLVSAISATTAEASFPVANLKNSLKYLPWRSTSVASEQKVRIDLTTSQTLSMVAALFTNLSATATIKVYLYTLPTDPAPVYTSAATAVFNQNVSVSGLLAQQNTFSYGAGSQGVVYFPETTVQRIDIGFTDASNSDGYIQVGNIVVGKYWKPEKNFAKGETFQIVDNSSHYRTESAQLFTEDGSKFRKIGFRLDTMMATDRDNLVNILRSNGKKLPIWFSLYPEDSDVKKENLYMMQGKLEDLSQLEHPLTLYYGFPLSFLEV